MVTRGHSGDLRAELHALRPVDYRPIVRISGISQKMSNLDFQLRCAEERTDEIGTLAHSLNTLATGCPPPCKRSGRQMRLSRRTFTESGSWSMPA